MSERPPSPPFGGPHGRGPHPGGLHPGGPKNFGKSYQNKDPIITYCVEHSLKQTPAEKELQESTLAKERMAGALGAPEVLQLGKNFIELIGAKRALDIGTFTGASALAWAVALPEDGQVHTFDVDHTPLENTGLPVFNKYPEYKKKIVFNLGSAMDKLDELIANGEEGKFDFSFIDANKDTYPEYYEKSMKLLRKGGVILIDNSLMFGSVLNPIQPGHKAIDACNKKIFADQANANILLTLGDGTHVVFKR
uniref:O-methyltransferase n=1 Tax=Panagrellus redivivus TaxID=6233 RepID=A0A7E4ZSJ0_PANRE